MTLSTKISLYLLLLGVCLGLGTYGAISLTIFPAFEEFEADAATEAIARVERAMDAERLALETMLIEYAHWTDTYEFVLGNYDAYVAENLEEVSYWRGLNIDYVLVFDSAGNLKWSTDTGGDAVEPVDQSRLLPTPLGPDHPLFANAPGQDKNSGIIRSRSGLLLAAAAPIVRSYGDGDPAGTFVIARRIDADLADELAERGSADLAYHPIGEDPLPLHTAGDIADMAAAGELRDVHRAADLIIGHRILLDPAGQPIALAEVWQPPQITAIGRQAITAAMLLICIVTALFLVIGLVVLKQVLVRPVNELSRSMQKIRESGDLDVQIGRARGDEIGELAREFDELTTNLHEAQSELVETRDVALEASRAKSEFLARMSHEIRTPMNGVLGMTELLRNTSLDFDQRRFADTIYTSAESLLNIINDILDFSKIEAGKLELELRDINLGALVEETVESLAPQAQKKGLELINDVASAVYSPVRGDPLRIRQVLTNLVANAIKFTDRGEVVVRAAADDRGDGQVDVQLDVVDTGIGIRSEKLEAIFDSFAQEDGSTTRMYGGTGLGLAISRQLVDLMGGRLEVDSKPGFGSRFHFGLCLQRSEAAPQASCATLRSVAGKRVLVVDDNHTNREILEQQFAGWRAQCDSACDADQAMVCIERSLVRDKPYDLLILDMHMPRVDGVQLARRIRARAGCAEVPILLLSSVATPASEGTLDTLRIAGQLTKPIRQGQLYDALNAVLSGSAIEEDYPHSRHGSVRKLGGSVLLAEDNPVNQAVAVGMLDALGIDVSVVADGKAAVRAARERSFDLLLMDCQMPVLDGLAATRRIRELEAADNRPRLPIVALTANAMSGDRERCLEAGMDDYLGKPFTMDQLHAVLSVHLLPDSGPAREPAESAVTEPAARGCADALDRSVLDSLAELGRPGAPCLVGKVVGIYLENSGDIVARLSSAVEDADAAAIREAAHALKSSSMNVGATRLAELCKELETMARERRLADLPTFLHRLGQEHAQALDALREEVEVVSR